MVIRLAVIGTALVVGGLVNVSGYGKITLPLGVVALLSSGVLWFVHNRNGSPRR